MGTAQAGRTSGSCLVMPASKPALSALDSELGFGLSLTLLRDAFTGCLANPPCPLRVASARTYIRPDRVRKLTHRPAHTFHPGCVRLPLKWPHSTGCSSSTKSAQLVRQAHKSAQLINSLWLCAEAATVVVGGHGLSRKPSVSPATVCTHTLVPSCLCAHTPPHGGGPQARGCEMGVRGKCTENADVGKVYSGRMYQK